jgi:hypothetical protein
MEDLYTYLGYIVIAILFYLIYITLFPSATSEGFMGFGSDSDSDSKGKTENKNTRNNNSKFDMLKIQDSIDDLNDKTRDAVNSFSLLNNRKQWEDLIISIEDRINSITLAALPTLSKKISSNPNDDDIEKIIEKMNILNSFRATLTENMKYLDGLE